MPKLDNETILLAFAVVTGLAVLLQTIFLLAIFISVRKAVVGLRNEVEKLRSSLMPVIYDTRDILAGTRDIFANTQDFLANAHEFLVRVTPKVEAAVGDLTEVTRVLRVQSAQVQSSATEIMERVRRQSDRVDGMVSTLLDTVDRAGGYVANVVTKPVRQISNLLGSVKAIVETLRGPGPQPRQ
jgi:uncharacterized protein YoxC